MVRRYTAGFEGGNLLEASSYEDGFITTITAQADVKRTGNYAMRIDDIASSRTYGSGTDTTSGLHFNFPFGDEAHGGCREFYARFAWRYDLGNTSMAGMTRTGVMAVSTGGEGEGAQRCLALMFNAACCLLEVTNQRHDGGGWSNPITWAYLGTHVLRENTWYIIEAHWRLDFHLDAEDIYGLIEIRVNGEPDITYTGWVGPEDKKTWHWIDYVFFGTSKQWEGRYTPVTDPGLTSAWLGPDTTYYDDIAINDTAGTVENSWIGMGGQYQLMPNAEGPTLDWQLSAGTVHWSLLDEIPPNTTDYVYSNSLAAGTTDLLEYASLPAGVTGISQVQVGWHAAASAVGYVPMIPILRQDGTNYPGDTLYIATTQPTYSLARGTPHYVQPNGSGAWGTVAVNALIAGFQTA